MEGKTASTHMVLKISDCRKYLNPREIQDLFSFLNKVAEGRVRDGLKIHYYAIVNHDEEYIGEILKVIEEGERKKGTWEDGSE